MQNNQMNKGLILFDFDGTIANTMHFGIEISNKLAGIYNYNVIHKHHIELLRNQSIQDLLKKSGISVFKMPLIIYRFRKEYTRIMHLIQPFENIAEVITKLHENYRLGIVTSNSKTTVDYFLKNHKLASYFEFISAGASLMGKQTVLRKICKKQQQFTPEIYYIGDETRDILASRHSQIKCVSVTWGYNSKEVLQSYNPDYLIDTPLEMLQLFISSK